AASLRRGIRSWAFPDGRVALPFRAECLARAHQLRLGGALRNLQHAGDLRHRELVSEAELEYARVVRWKPVDRAAHGAAFGVGAALVQRVAKIRQLHDLGQRPLLAELFEALRLRLPRRPAARVDQLVAADLAQPREQRRTTAETLEAAHGV